MGPMTTPDRLVWSSSIVKLPADTQTHNPDLCGYCENREPVTRIITSCPNGHIVEYHACDLCAADLRNDVQLVCLNCHRVIWDWALLHDSPFAEWETSW